MVPALLEGMMNPTDAVDLPVGANDYNNPRKKHFILVVRE